MGFCTSSAISHNELWESTSTGNYRQTFLPSPRTGTTTGYNKLQVNSGFGTGVKFKNTKPIQWEHGVDKHWFPTRVCSACQVGEAAAIGESQEVELNLHEQAAELDSEPKTDKPEDSKAPPGEDD